jgi:tetratricopeptide (TPR) repeat protein
MYERALILEPASSEIHNNLGKLHARQKHYQQAIEHFQKALENKPSLSESHLNLADIYLKQLNDKQKALYHLRTWLAQAPQDKRAAKIRKTIERIERKDKKRTSNIERKEKKE